MSQLQSKARSLSADLLKAVSKLQQDASPKSVHKLRTTIRRIESLVQYGQPKLSKKQQRAIEEIADLRKRAGKIRDLDVQLDLLGAIGNGSTAADRRTLTQTLSRKRTRQVRRLTSLLKKVADSRLAARLQKITGKLQPADSADEMALPLQQAEAELSKLAAGYGQGQPLKPARLHQLRIDLKQVRYTAELAGGSTQQEQFLAVMKAVQDAIGEWHDWEILVKTAEKQFADRVNCPLLTEIRALMAAKYSFAASAVTGLFATGARAARKQPRSAAPVSVLARRA